MTAPFNPRVYKTREFKLPDLEGLAIFAYIAETGSFTLTANALGVDKATVSRAVSRLETRFGVRLVHRTSRRTELTDIGRAMATRAKILLAEAEAAEREARSQSMRLEGAIRLSVPMSLGLQYLTTLLPGFLQLYPGISVDLQIEAAQDKGTGGDCDAALLIRDQAGGSQTIGNQAFGADNASELRRLSVMRMYLVASPAYLDRKRRPEHPEDLLHHVGLSYARHAGAPETWDFRRGSAGKKILPPQGPLCVTTPDALLPALVAGMGMAVMPRFAVNGKIASGELEIVLPEWSLPPLTVDWLTRHGKSGPSHIDALADFLAKNLMAMQ
jgi:DNA-binding transcriptional LysR family regulator